MVRNCPIKRGKPRRMDLFSLFRYRIYTLPQIKYMASQTVWSLFCDDIGARIVGNNANTTTGCYSQNEKIRCSYKFLLEIMHTTLTNTNLSQTCKLHAHVVWFSRNPRTFLFIIPAWLRFILVIMTRIRWGFLENQRANSSHAERHLCYVRID